MRLRTEELRLLLFTLAITVSGYGLISLGSNAELPANIVPFLGLVVALLLVAHLAVRRYAPMAHPLLLPVAAFLNGIGYVMITRLDPDLASRQSAWTLIGMCALVGTLAFSTNLDMLAPYRYTLALVGVILLLLPTLPKIGQTVNGARIWLRFGQFSIQPGEFAKIVLAMFLAGYLVDKRELLTISTRRIGPFNVPDIKHFGPLGLAWGMALIVMVYQRDLGSSLLFFTLFVVMLYLATARTVYVLAGVSLFGLGAAVGFRTFNHVQERVTAWTGAFDVPKDEGFQVVEAAFALADGGLTGVGLGQGTPGRIPAAETDMIFAAIGEELGLMGATAILFAYLIIVSTGLSVAVKVRSPFQKLLAAGLTALIGFQVFIIIGGVIRVLPLTGVTLPFVSYGGSSLISNYIILGILMRVSHNANVDVQSASAPTPLQATPTVAVSG